MKWRVAIRRRDPVTRKLWKPTRNSVVCHFHFTIDDYRSTGISGERSRLKPDVVPSVFDFKDSGYKDVDDTMVIEESPRAKRLKSRSTIPDCPDAFNEVEIGSTPTIDSKPAVVEEIVTETENQAIQCDIPTFYRFSIECFKYDDRMVNYYTGFTDYSHFMLFFECLGKCAYELDFKCSKLHQKDQLFLTLIKLRQNKDDIELATLFKVSDSTVSRIVITWINFLFFQLKELDIWPSKDVVQEHMPTDFKRKFPNTRVILDATEVPIDKPSNVNNQSSTWSKYKHKNTLKAMIGCSPKGAVTFVSDAYGGSASDRQIIEKSSLMNPNLDMFEKGDSIMADRGIMVQDLFANRDVFVNTPTFLKGRSQLDAQEVVHDRRVASKRIHIERVIGLSKTFKILKQNLPNTKLPLGSRIIFVCFAISNFRKNIVPKTA